MTDVRLGKQEQAAVDQLRRQADDLVKLARDFRRSGTYRDMYARATELRVKAWKIRHDAYVKKMAEVKRARERLNAEAALGTLLGRTLRDFVAEPLFFPIEKGTAIHQRIEALFPVEVGPETVKVRKTTKGVTTVIADNIPAAEADKVLKEFQRQEGIARYWKDEAAFKQAIREAQAKTIRDQAAQIDNQATQLSNRVNEVEDLKAGLRVEKRTVSTLCDQRDRLRRNLQYRGATLASVRTELQTAKVERDLARNHANKAEARLDQQGAGHFPFGPSFGPGR